MAADSIRNGGMMVVMHLSPASPGGGHLIRSCGDETIGMTHVPVLLLGGSESCKSTAHNRGVNFCL